MGIIMDKGSATGIGIKEAVGVGYMKRGRNSAKH